MTIVLKIIINIWYDKTIKGYYIRILISFFYDCYVDSSLFYKVNKYDKLKKIYNIKNSLKQTAAEKCELKIFVTVNIIFTFDHTLFRYCYSIFINIKNNT